MNRLDFVHKLHNILPGEEVSHLSTPVPETSIYFANISEKSLVDFHNYSLNPRLYEFYEFDPFKSFNDTRRYYDKMLKRMHVDSTHYYWFVHEKGSDALIGSACLASINFDRRSVEWGIGIDPDYWGRNYNLQVFELLKHYIFNVLNLNRIYGRTMISNERAISAVKASGCVFEGILREFYKKESTFIDAWSYSLLAKDYYNSIGTASPSNIKISMASLIEIVSKILGDPSINESASMENCLNWDSLAHTNIIITLSTQFDVVIAPQDFARLSSIELIYQFLNK